MSPTTSILKCYLGVYFHALNIINKCNRNGNHSQQRKGNSITIIHYHPKNFLLRPSLTPPKGPNLKDWRKGKGKKTSRGLGCHYTALIPQGPRAIPIVY